MYLNTVCGTKYLRNILLTIMNKSYFELSRRSLLTYDYYFVITVCYTGCLSNTRVLFFSEWLINQYSFCFKIVPVKKDQIFQIVAR